MSDRTVLSVGLTQVFADREDRAKFMPWLAIQSPVGENAMNALLHINELEALIAIEKYATLSRMVGAMRDDLAEHRCDHLCDQDKGYQRAINLVMDTLESIDIETQAATSISEISAANVLKAAEQIRSQDDYAAVVQFAKAINDGCC